MMGTANTPKTMAAAVHGIQRSQNLISGGGILASSPTKPLTKEADKPQEASEPFLTMCPGPSLGRGCAGGQGTRDERDAAFDEKLTAQGRKEITNSSQWHVVCEERAGIEP